MRTIEFLNMLLGTGYPIFAPICSFALAFLLRRLTVVVVPVFICPLFLFRLAYVPGVGFDGEPLVLAVMLYVLTVMTGLLGVVLAVPIRNWLRDSGSSLY